MGKLRFLAFESSRFSVIWFIVLGCETLILSGPRLDFSRLGLRRDAGLTLPTGARVSILIFRAAAVFLRVLWAGGMPGSRHERGEVAGS